MTKYHVLLSKTVYLTIPVEADRALDAVGEALDQADHARAEDATFEDTAWTFDRVLVAGCEDNLYEVVP